MTKKSRPSDVLDREVLMEKTRFFEGEVFFLGEGIEKAPCVTRLEYVVLWFTPFVKDGEYQSIGTHTYITSSDHQNMGSGVVEGGCFLGGNAFILVVPFVHQHANGMTYERGQTTHYVTGVFASQLHFPVEAQVVTNKDGGFNNTTGQSFVAHSNLERGAKNLSVVIVGGITEFIS